jgi:hypothetical protein
MRRDRLGDGIVDQARGFASGLGRRDIDLLAGHGRDHLDVDAEPVHFGDALVDARELAGELPHLGSVHGIARG